MSNVRVVLDSTALVAYAALRGMATAELVAMVEEEGTGAFVGIPAACFLAAYEQLNPEERERLTRLATKIDGVTVILPLTGTETVEVARLGPVMGHAIVEARTRDAYLATYDGAQARRELPEYRVLDLEDQ
ncbi:hypothetical protein Cs7R123_01200 [Catellatospora sp. TT07R-123]|uniref:hypothetical protein n=1 Tax=Catellatospora sp. TT07R-123 TaxID=2733863 RepID=UPI001B14A951|nr:hypothetical protein [Catellatospora sp. TT07R-123]GHJ42778.1 hypothetical protein Cs7R123_01200 [Catellatospora sp. TT07R-123]